MAKIMKMNISIQLKKQNVKTKNVLNEKNNKNVHILPYVK